MKIEIPPSLLSQIPTMAASIRAVFRNPILYEQIVGSFYFKNRIVPVYASECYIVEKRKRTRTLSTYDPFKDKIFVYRSLIERDQVSEIATERILAHEVAHALDRRRIKSELTYLTLVFPDAAPQRMDYWGRMKYACRRTEFDAEMASIIQIGIPHILRRPDASQIVSDFFNKNNFLFGRYRPFKDLTFTGYVRAWSHEPELCNEFFEIFSYGLRAALASHDTEVCRISACSTTSRNALRPRTLLPA